MGHLYMMTTIVDRKIAKRYVELYEQNDNHVMFMAYGVGTATSDVLDYLGLDHTEKTIIFSVQEEQSWVSLKKQLEKKLKIDAPGNGIAFTIPLSSIGGNKALQFLTENREFQKEEESTLKDTTHELIVVIAEQGNIDLVMDSAREAGAYGGTVIHAKGTGTKEASKFMGVSIAAEKEMIFIVTQKAQKNAIMKAVMTNAGLDTPAKAIVFSLPVTDTAGLRLIED